MATEKSLDININTSDAQKNVEGLSASLGSLGASFLRMGAIIGGFTALNTLVTSFNHAIDSAVKFEKQIAEIQKVTSAGVAQQMGQEIQRMASRMPVARDNLADIVEEAGRLGVNGIDNISAFTESVAKLEVATNLTAKEASKNFARILTVTGTATDKIDNLGSSVNELSNNMATSADEIVGGMQRASATAAQFGLQAEEIAAVSASINEVSATARRANTRLRRLFQELQSPDKVQDVANALGLTAQQFRNMKEQAPVELMLSLVGAFKEGGDAADQLRTSLGSASRQAVAGLAQNIDGLREALDMSARQFEENTSLQREYQIQSDTTAARQERLANNFENLATQIGESLKPAYDGLIQSVNTLLETMTNKELQNFNTAIDTSLDSVRELDSLMTTMQETAGTEFSIFGQLSRGGVDEVEREISSLILNLQERDIGRELMDSIVNGMIAGLRQGGTREELISRMKSIVSQFGPQINAQLATDIDIPELGPIDPDTLAETERRISNIGMTSQEIVDDFQVISEEDLGFIVELENSVTTASDVRNEIKRIKDLMGKGLLDEEVGQKRIKELQENLKSTNKEFKNLENNLSQFEKTAQGVAQGAASAFESTFFKAMNEGFDSVEDGLRAFGQAFVKQLQRMAAAQAATSLFGTRRTDDGNLQATGIITEAIGTFFGDTPGVQEARNGTTVTFKDGDKFAASQSMEGLRSQVGSNGGSKQETNVGEVNVNVTTGVQQTVRAEIQRLMPQIQKAALEGVKESTRRGGSTSQTLDA